MRSSYKVNLVGVDGLLRLDGSHGNYVKLIIYLAIRANFKDIIT